MEVRLVETSRLYLVPPIADDASADEYFDSAASMTRSLRRSTLPAEDRQVLLDELVRRAQKGLELVLRERLAA
jgi:hypothetical protein